MLEKLSYHNSDNTQKFIYGTMLIKQLPCGLNWLHLRHQKINREFREVVTIFPRNISRGERQENETNGTINDFIKLQCRENRDF